MIGQDLYRFPYQTILITLLKEKSVDAIIKKCNNCATKYKGCLCCLEYKNFKDDLIEYKCLCCNRNYQKKVWWKLKEEIDQYKFSNHDTKNFILFLQKDVDDWKKLNGTSLPEKEDLYSEIKMENATNTDYAHNFFWNKNIRGMPWFKCSKSNIIVFNNFRKMYLEKYVFDLAQFPSAPG